MITIFVLVAPKNTILGFQGKVLQYHENSRQSVHYLARTDLRTNVTDGDPCWVELRPNPARGKVMRYARGLRYSECPNTMPFTLGKYPRAV